MGAKPIIYTPDRITEGYGINKRIIDSIYNSGINYIITCDNGIAAYDEVAYAKGLGIEVIITDHHEIPYNETEGNREYIIPPADAVCNPKQPDCEYPYKGLCGGGVAYKLITCLFEKLHIYDVVTQDILLQYAAIATVADVMDLTGENRIIVKEGLKRLSNDGDRTTCGLKAIKKVNDLMNKQIGTYHIGFVIGPCFNAAGRIETAKTSFDLLLAKDDESAMSLAYHLKAFENIARRLCGATKTAVISFIDLYPKVRRNFPEAREVTQEEQLTLGETFVEIAAKYGMTLRPCAEGQKLAQFGADCSGCQTVAVLENAIGKKLKVPKKNSARKECACFLNGDIGAYNSCGHLCRYCYANANAELVRQNMMAHNPASPLLIGELTPDDKIFNTVQKSWSVE